MTPLKRSYFLTKLIKNVKISDKWAYGLVV